MPRAPGLKSPSLAGLSYLLKQEVKWPKNFEFNYNKELESTSCGTLGCAIGLAQVVWPKLNEESFHSVYETLGLSPREGERIFYSGDTYGKGGQDEWEYVTPQEVAEEIDKYLGKRAAKGA